MTDEEIEKEANAYIRENVCNKERFFGSQSVCSDKAIRECNECGNLCYFAKINRKSYLDGLTEGRKPKWHDLRKDPNDLPKHSGEYWCKWEDSTYSTEHYFDDSGFGSYVIAWTELPKFEE